MLPPVLMQGGKDCRFAKQKVCGKTKHMIKWKENCERENTRHAKEESSLKN